MVRTRTEIFYETTEFGDMKTGKAVSYTSCADCKNLKQQLKDAESVIDSLEDNLLHELNYGEWLEIKSELEDYRNKYKTGRSK